MAQINDDTTEDTTEAVSEVAEAVEAFAKTAEAAEAVIEATDNLVKVIEVSTETVPAWTPPEDALSLSDIQAMLLKGNVPADGMDVTVHHAEIHADKLSVQVRERLNNSYVEGLAHSYRMGYDDGARVPDGADGIKTIPRPHVHVGLTSANVAIMYLGDGFNRHQGAFLARGKDAKLRVRLFAHENASLAFDIARAENAHENSDPTRAQPLTTDEERVKSALSLSIDAPGYPALTVLQLSNRFGRTETTINQWIGAGKLREAIATRYAQLNGGKLPDKLPTYTTLIPLLTTNNKIIRGGSFAAPVVELGVKAITSAANTADVKKWAKIVSEAHADARDKATADKVADPESVAQEVAKATVQAILTPPTVVTQDGATSAAEQGVGGNMPPEPPRPENVVWDAMDAFFDFCAAGVKVDPDNGKPIIDWRYTAESIKIGVQEHFMLKNPSGTGADRVSFIEYMKQLHGFTGEILIALAGQATGNAGR